MLTGRFSVYVYMHEHMHVESGGFQKHFAPPLLAWNLPIRLTSKSQGSSHLYHLSTGVASICHHHSQHFYMGSGDLTQVIMLERQEFTYQMIYPHGPLFFNIIFFSPPPHYPLKLPMETSWGGLDLLSTLPSSYSALCKVTEEYQAESSHCLWVHAGSVPQWPCVIGKKFSLFIFKIRWLVQYASHCGCPVIKQDLWKVLT